MVELGNGVVYDLTAISQDEFHTNEEDEERLRKLAELRASAERRLGENTSWSVVERTDDARFAAMEDLRRRVDAARRAGDAARRGTLRLALERWRLALRRWRSRLADAARRASVVARRGALRLACARWRDELFATKARAHWVRRLSERTLAAWKRAVEEARVLSKATRRWRHFAAERKEAKAACRLCFAHWRRLRTDSSSIVKLRALERWRRRAQRRKDDVVPLVMTRATMMLQRSLRQWRSRTTQRQNVAAFAKRVMRRQKDERRVVAFGNWLGFLKGRRRWLQGVREERQRKFLLATLRSWREASAESRLRKLQLANALHVWAANLQGRCFAALRQYAVLRRRKKIEATAALSKRVALLQDRGCARFLAAADESRASRAETEKHLTVARALRERELALKYARIWRRNVESRRNAQLFSRPPLDLSTYLPPMRTYDAAATRLLPAKAPRRKPRRLSDEARPDVSAVEEEPPQETRRDPSPVAPVPVAPVPAPVAPVPPPVAPVPPPPPQVPSRCDVGVGTADDAAKTSVGLQTELPEKEDVEAAVAAAVEAAVSKKAAERQKRAAVAVRGLEAQLRTWQRQKKAWLAALRRAKHSGDDQFLADLSDEYKAWWRDVEPKVRLAANYVAVAASRSSSQQQHHSSPLLAAPPAQDEAVAGEKKPKRKGRRRYEDVLGVDDDDVENLRPLFPSLIED
mmetsp:Transcript_776/g.2211  ORF Transcript_776/g.2211 Transcript_776/m.2211 type:complete len:694 (-) Transcript_776:71-2152(-)